MTQLDSIMEDKQRTPVQTDSCRRRSGGEGPPNNNVSSSRKFEKEKLLKEFRSKIPSPLVQRASSKTIRVYRNGEPNHPAENVSLCLERGREWSDVLVDISNAILFAGDVRNIYSMTGVQIMSTSQLVEDHEYVVSAGEAFKPYSYHRRAVPSPSTVESASAIHTTKVVPRPKSGNNRLNRTHRANVTQSVVIEGNAFNMEASCSSGPSSLTKTFSEHDVSSMPSSVFSPRSKVTSSSRKNFSPKPRPTSAYRSSSPSSSGNFLENHKRSPVISSRIPKRINNVGNGDNSPTVVKSSLTLTTTSSTTNVAMTKSAVVCRAKKTEKPTPDKRLSRDVIIQPSRREREFVRPRLVTVIRSGMKPRKACRFLLNKKTAHSFDQVLNDMTESIKPDWGAVRKVYTLNGKEVAALEDFFKDDDVFIACPNDKVTLEDFDLDSEECKSVQPFVKASLMSSQTRKVRAVENASRSPQRRPKSSTNSATTAEPVNSNHLSHPKSIPLDHFPPPILEKYDVGNIIGDGNFAVVRECVDLTTRKKYAMKVIDKSKCYGRDVPPEHEVIILSSVHHPNIILLYEQYDFSNELYVIMELVPGGDLFDAIAEATKFSEDVSRHMTRDVASALSFLHSHSIVHRDIKPENLLVAVGDGGRRRIKLGDFGLAQIVRGPMYVVCGTPTYVAPEILAESGYGMKVDVWALGVILYVLLCGYPPFVSTTGEQEDLFDMILSGAYDFPAEHWDEISDDAKDIVTRMIESDVDMRLSAEEVLDHPWLATNKEDREQKRKRFFRRDFRFSVFEAMGLTDLPVSNGQMSLN